MAKKFTFQCWFLQLEIRGIALIPRMLEFENVEEYFVFLLRITWISEWTDGITVTSETGAVLYSQLVNLLHLQ